MFNVIPNSSLSCIRNTFHGFSDEGDEERRDPFSFPSLTGSAFADANENPNGGVKKDLLLFYISYLSPLNYPNLLLSGLICIIEKFVRISDSNTCQYAMIFKTFYRTIRKFWEHPA